MPGVCRPANQTPRAASCVVWSGEETDGTRARDTHPQSRWAESSQSSKQRHFPPFVPANCSILRRTQTPIHTLHTVKKRQQADVATPTFLVHYTQTQRDDKSRQVYKQPAAMAYMQMSVSSSETIGQPANCPRTPTNTWLVPNNWNWCRFGPTTAWYTRPQLLSRAGRSMAVCVCVCVLRLASQINTCLSSASCSIHPRRERKRRVHAGVRPPAILPPIYGLETNSARRPGAEREKR